MKTVLLITLGMLVVVEAKAEYIRGTVTYYYNTNYGQMADAGSDVYVASTQDVKDTDVEAMVNVSRANFYWRLVRLTNGTPDEKSLEQLKELNADMDDKLKALYNKSLEQFKAFLDQPNLKHTLVDSAGNYSVKVSPGSYYVMIRSSHGGTSTIIFRGCSS
jgi:hypothetical protein